jgi:hypothetical protein
MKAFGSDGEYESHRATSAPAVQRFRNHAVVNTYAEADPSVSLERFSGREFQVGVDRLLVRLAG